MFEKSKLAEQDSKEAEEKEEGILGDYENKISEYVGNNRETVEVNKDELLKANNTLQTSKFSIDSERIKGDKFYLSKIENVVSIEINGDNKNI